MIQSLKETIFVSKLIKLWGSNPLFIIKMKNKDWNLSEKISEKKAVYNDYAPYILTKDIKEFIKKLKDFKWKSYKRHSNGIDILYKDKEIARFFDYLDFIAGEELI